MTQLVPAGPEANIPQKKTESSTSTVCHPQHLTVQPKYYTERRKKKHSSQSRKKKTVNRTRSTYKPHVELAGKNFNSDKYVKKKNVLFLYRRDTYDR